MMMYMHTLRLGCVKMLMRLHWMIAWHTDVQELQWSIAHQKDDVPRVRSPPRQLLLALAEWLCAEHARDARAARLVQDMHLFLMPSMNPDGFEARSRGNARRVRPSPAAIRFSENDSWIRGRAATCIWG